LSLRRALPGLLSGLLLLLLIFDGALEFLSFIDELLDPAMGLALLAPPAAPLLLLLAFVLAGALEYGA
jgi:hypothetical protein